MAADTYVTRTEARAGTQAAPELTNVTIGNPLQRLTNPGTNGDTGQVPLATGGTDRLNDQHDA
jgi:hypothetical protein